MMKEMYQRERNECAEMILEFVGRYVEGGADEERIYEMASGMQRLELIRGNHEDGTDVESLYESVVKQAERLSVGGKADLVIMFMVSKTPGNDVDKLIARIDDLITLSKGDVALSTLLRNRESDRDEVIVAFMYKKQDTLIQ